MINNKIDCVRYLLSKGADPNQSDEFTNVHSMAKKLHLRPEQGTANKNHFNSLLLFFKFQFIQNEKENFVIVFHLERHLMVLQHFIMRF